MQKSDGARQRLIIDAARANHLRVDRPGSGPLGSLSRSPPGGGQVFVGMSDIYHRLKQPWWMQTLFCFDPVPAHWVWEKFDKQDLVFLCPRRCLWLVSKVPRLEGSTFL